MKSYILIAIFLTAECLGAERSRQRSPIRSVPVAASVKREVDFDCPEEFGYYPHPTDCTLYYVCVFGGALLESCTGGLMYSHELQTCDWPRNVGCDATGAVIADDYERLNERQPPPPTSRRNPPPPPPSRAQPHPVITSRGQPKFNRQEYEKQQQLYAEVDDLPPVEEIENDRQQRVYRGQPSTIGQVQKDRDGYHGSQGVSAGRTLNSNIIPSSIAQNSKIGSFSFGTQLEDRRTATATQTPQSYSLEPTESVTPSSYSPSPRPKMLYNGSQTYSPDQYDPYYAVYDEDGELYKDTDYVQQYNSASLRPAVQQTYRGTPPSRRPVETYSARPVADDYDDALIQGPIINQNQYQTSVRQPARSSTDENRSRLPASSTVPNAIDGFVTSIPSTLSTSINLSSHAKPFEKTDNAHRLLEPSTEITTRRPTTRVTENNKNFVSLVHESPDVGNKKMISLTTGFSIRRNVNNTKNPYTLTIISKPFENNSSVATKNTRVKNNKKHSIQRLYYDINEKDVTQTEINKGLRNGEQASEEVDIVNIASHQKENDFEGPADNYMSSSVRTPTYRPRIRFSNSATPTTTTKEEVFKRPVSESTTSSISPKTFTDSRLDRANENSENKHYVDSNKSQGFKQVDYIIQDEDLKYKYPIVSPYKTLDNLRNTGRDYLSRDDKIDIPSSTMSTGTSSLRSVTTTSSDRVTRKKPSYYLYNIKDDENEQTTEIYKSGVKQKNRILFKDAHSSTPKIVEFISPSTTLETNEEVVNIGFKNKKQNASVQKPSRNSFKHVSILTEPSVLRNISPSVDNPTTVINHVPELKYDSVQTANPTISLSSEIPMMDAATEGAFRDIIPNIDYELTTKSHSLKSKFSSLMNKGSRDEEPRSHKFKKIIETEIKPVDSNIDHYSERSNSNLETNIDSKDLTTETQIRLTNDFVNDIASTTSTTKSTTTFKIDVENKQTSKSLSYPTRASRINPAIKLAAASVGGGRRSYQSPSNCSSDNSLQVNPKCNEIKYPRPTSTRGRGSAHFSTSGGSEAPQQTPNRGTPPTRSRPTLKPSTAIVTKTVDINIYAHPPSRPAPVYPQPTPDKTAAKCRKDVCLLPDCFCGGKDIPGELPVDKVPQIVLLTFDDSVNDLNKGLYTDLFEKGRVNPNGCPITATFYVSHEWTDYSQVQNLYSAGHEMASHTVSHSFGEQFSQKKWNREVGGQREILAAYGGVKLDDVRGMRAPFLSVGGNKMFKMLYDSNFTYDSSLPVYENRPPSWPYTLDYKLFHDCMIPPCPTKSYPGVWEVPMVMWQDLNGGRCSMGDACANPPDAEGVYKMILKNFDRHYTSNRAPFGLFYHAAWFTQPHHKEGFIMFLDFINKMNDVWIITNWQALQWVRDPTPISRLNNFQPFQCNYADRPKKCNNPKVCNLWHKSGVRYMRTCQPCPPIYPWTGKTGISSSRIDNEIEE
nr:uncharacterized protein LOC116779016 isoform X4 [Danaus plexippus plexippus]